MSNTVKLDDRGVEIESRDKSRSLYRIRELEAEAGEAWLFGIEKGGSRAFNGYPSKFIVHAVKETRHDHDLMRFRPNTGMRYYVWSVGKDDEPYMIQKEMKSPSINKAAERYAFCEF